MEYMYISDHGNQMLFNITIIWVFALLPDQWQNSLEFSMQNIQMQNLGGEKDL